MTVGCIHVTPHCHSTIGSSAGYVDVYVVFPKHCTTDPTTTIHNWCRPAADLGTNPPPFSGIIGNFVNVDYAAHRPNFIRKSNADNIKCVKLRRVINAADVSSLLTESTKQVGYNMPRSTKINSWLTTMHLTVYITKTLSERHVKRH